jgi:hypothetical protein
MKLSYYPRCNIAYIRLRDKTEQVGTIRVSDELNVDLAPRRHRLWHRAAYRQRAASRRGRGSSGGRGRRQGAGPLARVGAARWTGAGQAMKRVACRHREARQGDGGLQRNGVIVMINTCRRDCARTAARSVSTSRSPNRRLLPPRHRPAPDSRSATTSPYDGLGPQHIEKIPIIGYTEALVPAGAPPVS